MALGRELIYSTLFAQLKQQLLQPIGLFNYLGRRPVPLSKLQSEQYPSLIMVEGDEDYSRHTQFAPVKVTLSLSLIIQNNEGVEDDESNVALLNNLADSVEDAVQNACGPTAQNVLGGLVQQAWIEGRQVVITGSWPQKWSTQVMGIKIVLPHSR